MWQFENDKIWDSYSNRGVIKEKFDDQMTEEERQFIISDIYSYYKNGEPIEAIADLYEVEVEDVKDAISTMKKQLSDENSDDGDLTDEFNLDNANTSNTIENNPEKRGDTIDFNNPEWDEIHGREVHGPFVGGGNVTHVEPQKPRPKKIFK